jgi:hypothetical protein
MASHPGSTSSFTPSSSPSSIIVGNGATLPVHYTRTVSFPTNTGSLHLNNVLISPSLIKNLVSVRALTRDNNVSVEFDNFGLSIKDLRTKTIILRSESSGDLYPRHVAAPSSSSHQALTAATSTELWHARLGHPGPAISSRILDFRYF